MTSNKDDFDLPFRDPNFPLRLFTHKEVEAINEKLGKSRSRRVRAALYPETFESGAAADEEILSAAYGGDSAVLRLAPAARELKEAVADIVAYAQDADFAAKFVPEIARLLADEDGDVVRNAAELTADLVKSESACHVVCRSPQLVAALLKAAAGTAGEGGKNDLRIKEAVASALLQLGKQEHGRLTIFKTGGIELLVRLLEAPAERVVNFAISILHGLLMYQEGAKLAVRMAGGIQKMVPLLPKWTRDPRFLAVVCDCLHLLAFGDAEAKLAIWNCKGPLEIVAVFSKARDEKLLWTASRLLKVLSTCAHNKEQIVESGGFETLIKKLGTDDPKLFQNYLTTLRNLSDAEADFPCDSTMISYLLQFLRHKEEETVEFAAGIFGNLSSDKPRLKESIFYAGGIDIILQTIRKTEREETLEPLLCSLRHLTSQHRLVDQVQKEMRELGGLELSLHQMQLSWQRPSGPAGTISWSLVKASCGLVRNLVGAEENHDAMVRQKIIPRLGQVLALAAKEDRKNQESMVNPTSPPSSASASAVRSSRNSIHRSLTLERGSTLSLVGGVDLNDIKEASIGALAILAKASMVNKEDVAALNVGPLLIKLRHDPTASEEVADACTALLEALRLEEEGTTERRKKEETKSEDEPEFGVKVEEGDRVIVARARSILDDGGGVGDGGGSRRGSAGNMKEAREGEEKRRRGFFGGGKAKKRQSKHQEQVIYENMQELSQFEPVAEEGTSKQGEEEQRQQQHQERRQHRREAEETKKKEKRAKPKMREEPVWLDSEL